MSNAYKGRCFCGEVELEVTGQPAVAGYCHCDDCQSWSAAPINAFGMWAPGNVRVTKGAASVGTFNRTEAAFRQFCKACGGHLMTDHPAMQLIDVPANLLQGFAHEPTLHVHYGNRMLRVKDGLPKFKDLPCDFGGSGETLPE